MSELVAAFEAEVPDEIASSAVTDSAATSSDNGTSRVDDESAHVSTPEGAVVDRVRIWQAVLA